MPLSLLLHLCMIFNVMGLSPAYILFFFQPCGKQTSVFIILLNCILLVTYKLWTNAAWLCEPIQKKDIQNHINLPWVRQQWLWPKQVACKALRVIENDCLLIVTHECWKYQSTAHPRSWYLWLHLPAEGLLFYFTFTLHYFRICLVPLHCLCCIIIALRMFHVNLSFGLEANYNDWYVRDFIQSFHITHSL